MLHGVRKVLIFVVLLATSTCGVAFSWPQATIADDEDAKQGRLGHLSQYIGTKHHEAILNDPQVRRALNNIVGQSLPHLLRNLEDPSTINFIGSWMVLRGAKKDEAYRERAIVVIDVFNGMVHAGIFSNGHRTVFSVKEEFGDVPVPLLEWVWSREINAIRSKIPEANFTYKKYQPKK
jgi:hypothetical protein